MSKLAEMLGEEIQKSREFPEKNFGLKVGAGYPELVRTALESKDIKLEIMMGVIISQLSMPKKEEFPALGEGDKFIDFIANKSGVYELPLKFLFWGIAIGRRMAETEMLEDLVK